MPDLKVGEYAYTIINHIDLYGSPETEVHGRVIGYYNNKYQLEVPYLGVLEISPDKLKGEKE